MPAPNATWIASMLDPYKNAMAAMGDNARNAVAAGAAASDSRNQRAQLAQRQKEFGIDSARQQGFLDLQREQFGAGQQRQDRAEHIKAFTDFQAAVDSGDPDQAELALQQLRILGVDVQPYESGSGGSANRMPSAMSIAAQESPTARIAQVQARSPLLAEPESPVPASEMRMGTAHEEAPKPASEMRLGTAEPGAGAPSIDAEEAEIDATLAEFEKSPPISKEDEEARQEYTFWAIQQKQKKEGRRAMEKASAEARAMDTPTAWAEQTDFDPKTGKGSGMNWRAVGGDAEGNPLPGNRNPFSPFGDDMGPRARPVSTTGVPEAPTEQPAGEAPATGGQLMRGYRLNFGGKVIEISPEDIQGRQVSRVQGVMQSLLTSAQTPEEKQAAQTALDAATKAVPVFGPEKAVQIGINFYQDTLDRQGKLKRAKVVGKGGAGTEGYGGIEGQTKEGSKRSFEAGRFGQKIIEDTLQKSNVRAVRDEIANADDALQKANSKDPLAQFASKATLQKMLMKGALSDRDVTRLEAAPGQWSRLEQWVNNWTEGGKVPDDVLRQIKEIAIKKRALLKQRLHEIGTAAKDRVTGNETLRQNMTPDELEGYGDEAYGAATGQFRKKKSKSKKGTASADEVRKALGK